VHPTAGRASIYDHQAADAADEVDGIGDIVLDLMSPVAFRVEVEAEDRRTSMPVEQGQCRRQLRQVHSRQGHTAVEAVLRTSPDSHRFSGGQVLGEERPGLRRADELG
jgi:hypothetical protein